MQTSRYSPLAKLLRILISIYRNSLSNIMIRCCRFHPSCSEYTLQGIDRFGAIKGLWLMSKRLMRCHPGFKGGYDPVPEAKSKKN